MVAFCKLGLLKTTHALFQRSILSKSIFVRQPWSYCQIINFKFFYSSQYSLRNEDYEHMSQSSSLLPSLLSVEKFYYYGRVLPPHLDKIVSSLCQKKNFTEEEALVLIDTCGRKSTLDVSRRVARANIIYQKTQNKSIHLYNKFLQCCVENNQSFVSTEILQEIKGLSLQPNETTYACLIAGHCLNGDVNAAGQIIEFLKASKLKVPIECYAYIAYGLCKIDKPEDAVKIIQHLNESNIPITWDMLTWLCRGLASSGKFEMLKDVVSQYASEINQTMTAFHLKDIFDELVKTSNEKIIEVLLDHVNVNVQLILDTSRMVKTMPLHFSSYLIEALYDKCQDVFSDTSEFACPEPILKHMLQYPKKFGVDELWNKTMHLKKFHKKPYFMEYFTLLMVLQNKSPHSIAFIDRLIANKVEIKGHMVLPLIIGQNDDHRGETMTYLENCNIDFIDQIAFCCYLKNMNLNVNVAEAPTLSEFSSELFNSHKKHTDVSVYSSKLEKAKKLRGEHLNQSLYNIIIEGKYHLTVPAFNTLLYKMQRYFSKFSPTMLSFIFCYYIESNQVSKARQFLEKYSNQMDLAVDIFPSSLWVNASALMKGFLTKYLMEKEGVDKGTWIVFCTLLDTDDTKNAAKLLASDISVSRSSIISFLSNLAFQDSLLDKYKHIIAAAKNLKGFDPKLVYLVLLKHLLSKGRDHVAYDIVEEIPFAVRGHFKTVINAAFLTQNKVPPYCSLQQALQPLANAVFRAHLIPEDVFSVLSNTLEKADPANLNLFVIYHLLSEFMVRLPLHDYYPVCEKLAHIAPKFQPELRSQILLDRIQKLIEANQIDDALKYTLTVMQKSNDSNSETWESVIHLFGKAVLSSERFDVLNLILDSSLVTLAESQALIHAYLLYGSLLQNNLTVFDKKSENYVTHLVKLLINANDDDMFQKVFDIVCKKLNETPSLLFNFLSAAIASEYQLSTVAQYFKQANLMCDQINTVASLSYRMAENFSNLKAIDTFFRHTAENSLKNHRFFNVELFRQFCCLYKTCYFDISMHNYLEKMVFLIPYAKNDAFVKSTHLNINTSAMFSRQNSSSNLICK